MGVRRALPRRAHGGDAGEVSAPQPSLCAPEITLVRGRGSFAAEVFLPPMSSPCPSPQGRGKATVTASATTRPSPPVFVPIYPELFTRRCVFKKRGGEVPRGGPWGSLEVLTLWVRSPHPVGDFHIPTRLGKDESREEEGGGLGSCPPSFPTSLPSPAPRNTRRRSWGAPPAPCPCTFGTRFGDERGRREVLPLLMTPRG